MKLINLLQLSSSLSSTAVAHYTFGRLIFDDKWTDTWEVISPEYGRDDLTYLLSPNVDPTSTDIVCGRNATVPWNKPKTAKIQAGARVGFAPGEPMLPSSDYNTPRIYHQGIVSAWLSKSPVDDLDNYRGDGDWFKIESALGRTEQSIDWSLPENKQLLETFELGEFYAQWGSFMVESWNFTIPATTPPGKYLLRFEHIYPNQESVYGAQYYPNCAHVEIVNNNANVGRPNPLVKIPGVYVWGQPDIYVDTYADDFNFSASKAPLPEVWKG